MSTATIAVLAIATGTTLWLLWYSRVHLPRVLEDRISDSVQAFGTAIELRFPSHEGLMSRVVELSVGIGRVLELGPRRLKDLEMAARLRDIGLCSVPYRLVNTVGSSSWNVAEKAAYFRHSEVGGAMLEMIPELRHLAEIVRYHHARYDGADDPALPYAEGLPMEARILRVVTDFVWHERLDGRAAARVMLAEGRGSVYWPPAVDALRAALVSTYVEERETAIV